MTARKVSIIITVLIFLLGVLPTPSTYAFSVAEGNVFDCFGNEENKQECADEEPPAIEADTNEETEGRTVGVTAWDYLKTIFALVFVVGLLFALLKFVNRKTRMYDKTRLMKNMGGISLGQQKSIQLVVVGETYYLIGVGDDIRLLKEITDQAEIERLTAFYEEVEIDPTSGLFGRLLAQISQSKKKKSNPQNEETPDFGNMFNTRLNEMKEERQRRIRKVTEKERDEDD